MMFELPAPAPWSGMHVLIVHFPIALLIFSPVMIAAAIVFRKWGRQFAVAAGFVLLAGAVAAQVAVMSGEAAEELAEDQGIESDPAAYELMEEHAEAAETVRTMFAVICLLYWAYLAATGLSKREVPVKLDVAVLAAFFLLSGAGALALANAAHKGGLLVHSHGILAPMDAAAAAAASAAGEAAGAGAESEHEEHEE